MRGNPLNPLDKGRDVGAFDMGDWAAASEIMLADVKKRSVVWAVGVVVKGDIAEMNLVATCHG